MKFKNFTLIIISCLFLGCKNETKPITPFQIRHVVHKPVYPYIIEFDQFVRETMEKTHLPGAAVAIVRDTEILLLKCYGVKTFGLTDSINIHSIFRIGSVSKGFATMLAGILVQENLIRWDDKVIQYLPDFKLKTELSTQQLTIRHILSHTTGLPSHTFTDLIELGIPYSTIVYNIRTVDVIAPVGKEYAYQNIMFSLIGDIVNKVTKKSYGTLLNEKVFIPLGMTDASVSYEEIMKTDNLAEPHHRRDSVHYVPMKIKPNYYSVLPAAGVNASISDMAKWMIALLGERSNVIKRETLREIYKPEIETPRTRHYEFFRWPRFKKGYYGFGWRILNYGGDTLIYHGGYVDGYRSEVAFSPTKKTGIVILTNSTGILANQGVRVFFDLFDEYKNH